MPNELIIYKYYNLGKVFSDNRFKIKKANDATIKFLRDKAVSQQDKQAVRSKRIAGIAFLGINQVGDCRFVTKSEDGERTYIQSIRFYDLHKRKPRSKDEILDSMRNSDIGVYCSDPSFLFWGAAYNATKDGYNIAIENRAPKGLGQQSPKIKALQDKFVLCKHLIAVLRAAPFYWNNMVGEYVKYFKLDRGDLKPARAVIEEGAEGPTGVTKKQTEAPKAAQDAKYDSLEDAQNYLKNTDLKKTLNSLPDEITGYRTIDYDEFKTLFYEDKTILGQWTFNPEGWASRNHSKWYKYDIKDKNERVVMFFFDKYKYRMGNKIITVRCRFKKEDVVAVGIGLYALPKTFDKTKTIGNSTIEIQQADFRHLEEFAVKDYGLKNIIEVVSVNAPKVLGGSKTLDGLFKELYRKTAIDNMKKYNIKDLTERIGGKSK